MQRNQILKGKIIYCDGSSLGNPGPAGFGVVAIDTDKKLIWEFGQSFDLATNNQMEIAACIFSLKLILESFRKNAKEDLKYELRLDSKYVILGATQWIKNWTKNNWKNSQKKEVLNKEMWQEMELLLREIELKKINLKWSHIYGHTGEKWNERCDEIAKSFAGKKEEHLRKGLKYLG